MRNLYIIDIEPLENRYTKQWHYFIPRRLKKLLPNFNVVQISGDTSDYKSTTSGKFFDFNKTCDYKASQARKISKLFIDNKVQPNDIFFFTDAWNQTIHTLRYLTELNGIPVKTVGIWHAGWYDKTDILGQTIKNTNWVKNHELSMYNAYDVNFFGTSHHLDTFMHEHVVADRKKALTVGYPLNYLDDLVVPTYEGKQDIVVFPHRLNDDKAPHVFDWIAKKVQSHFPDILFVKTQEHNLDKEEYYKLLNKAKVVFSCSKHENLGIGTYEAVASGCVPLVPDKLSYKEMYPISCRYTLHDKMYLDEGLWVDCAERILNIVKTYDVNRYRETLNIAKHIRERYFIGDNMFYIISRL